MWDWAIWGAVIVAGLAGFGALALFAVRVRGAWRDLGDTRRDLLGRLDDFASRAEETTAKIAAAGDTAGLTDSLGRLRVSLAELSVLRAALDEAQDTVGRVTAYLPRK
jgi:hypothetical protein